MFQNMARDITDQFGFIVPNCPHMSSPCTQTSWPLLVQDTGTLLHELVILMQCYTLKCHLVTKTALQIKSNILIK